METTVPVGRYAPSPSGRMHLGNVFTALVSWLSVRSRGGRWILRIEDLDPQRSKDEYAKLIEDDLRWLGLDWDEGGLEGNGNNGPYLQSLRGFIYEEYLAKVNNIGVLYPCSCRRSDIMATQAPHQSDGRIVYAGTCRPAATPPFPKVSTEGNTVRIWTPDKDQEFIDILYGLNRGNLARDCGDFVLRRADGAWAYQLAVVVDDGLMGITEVVRGNDLLLSTFQQLYLYRVLGLPTPEFAHVPLICNSEGRRLSKRDNSLSMDALRRDYKAEQILGKLAYLSGIAATDTPKSATELIELFDWKKIKPVPRIILT